MNRKASVVRSSRTMGRGLISPAAMNACASKEGRSPVASAVSRDETAGCLTVLLIGGPYRGMRIRENMNSKGLYFVGGARGEFVYRLYRREGQDTLAVPFSASAGEIQAGLFKLAASSSTK